MRFLQTEWHRHERDRNSWEIEKQEMKSRIAALEGAAKRADATQKALKKYVTILETKVKDQSAQLKCKAQITPDSGTDTDGPVKLPDREALLREKLRRKSPFTCLALNIRSNQAPIEPTVAKPAQDAEQNPAVEDEAQRAELKSFLDSCQAEFAYLMITPANPIPPRESPQMPVLDELREGESFGIPGAPEPMGQVFQNQMRGQMQNHSRDSMMQQQQHAPAPPPQPRQHQQQHAAESAGKGIDQAPAMVRSSNTPNSQAQVQFASWPSERQSVSVNARLVEQTQQAHERERENCGTPFSQAAVEQEKRRSLTPGISVRRH